MKIISKRGKYKVHVNSSFAQFYKVAQHFDVQPIIPPPSTVLVLRFVPSIHKVTIADFRNL